MIYDYNLIKLSACSSNEKMKCRDLIEKFIFLAEKAKREGLLAIEDNIEEMSNPMMKTGINLIVDGTDPVFVKEVLTNIIYFNNLKGKKLLEQFIILDGVLCIQKILREIDTYELAIALNGASPKVKYKILINMSQTAVIMIKEDMEQLQYGLNKESIKEAQEKIKNIYLKLIECGDIV